MKPSICASVTLALTLVAGWAWAHHNMSAAFDFNNRFTRTGTLNKTEWTNPHIGLSVDATSDQGQVETWLFEGPSPGFFRTRSVGKTVTVEASRARDGSLSGLIRLITLPDGTVVSLCPQNC